MPAAWIDPPAQCTDWTGKPWTPASDTPATVIDRCRGRARGVATPIGWLPRPDELNLEGLTLAPGALDRLLSIDRAGWAGALRSQSEFFARFGARLPQEMQQEHDGLAERIGGERLRPGARRHDRQRERTDTTPSPRGRGEGA